MSMSEPISTMAEPWDDLGAAPADTAGLLAAAAIVPKSSIAGRSLAAVIAIMTFLVALTTGGATMVVGAARDWRSEVGREVTIQVRPIAGRDIEADVSNALALARAVSGIADVRAYTKEESARLVEPWLGSGLDMNELPIPRMIVVKLLSGAAPDLASLRTALAATVPSASLDDHRHWMDRMRNLAGTAMVAGVAVLGLVLVVTVLSVTFATRGTMAANRPIIEVLHYVGATDDFVASQFQQHFLLLGFKGAMLGGGIAVVLFGFVEGLSAWLTATPSGEQAGMLLGNFSIGVAGYLAILFEIVIMAVVAAWTSRHAVNETLKATD